MMRSFDPSTGEVVWEGEESQNFVVKVDEEWRDGSFEERAEQLRAFAKKVTASDLAKTISLEMGKPLWESRQEVAAVAKKVEISIEAHFERSATWEREGLRVTHRPLGVIGVLGPYNFPAHLPCGHIIPALLAGNSIIFKPSELTPRVGEELAAMLPATTLIQGGAEVGQKLCQSDVDGICFTGSWAVGSKIALSPEKMLALEMGGNNPLVVWDVSDKRAAAYMALLSSFLTSGQRCSCAGRIITNDDAFLEELVRMASEVKVGRFDEEPFMGPVVSEEAASALMGRLPEGEDLLTMRQEGAFLTPGIRIVERSVDEEFFGPFVQVVRVSSFEEAVEEANRTQFGLAASLLSDEEREFDVRAGVVNWNAPTTGASSRAPFGGVGRSGNHRPSAYYATDYCTYPVASKWGKLALPEDVLPGVNV